MNIISRAVTHVLSCPESFSHEAGVGSITGVSINGFDEFKLMNRPEGVPCYLADGNSRIRVGTLRDVRDEQRDDGNLPTATLCLPLDSEFLPMFANLAMWGAAAAARTGGGR